MPDWKDIGKTTFGVVHTAGKGLASAFGAGSAAQGLESIEARAGLLPDWAVSKKGAPSPAAPTTSVSVSSPDYVVIVRGERADVLRSVAKAVVFGGARFEGTGYQPGEEFGRRFSFGYDAPTRVDLVATSGAKSSILDVSRVLFCGGSDLGASLPSSIVGGDLEDVLGVRWWQVFYHPSGILMDELVNKKDSETTTIPKTVDWDYKTTAAYQQALQKYRDAQAKRGVEKGRARSGPASVIPVSVPSFTLPTESAVMSSDDLLGDVIVGELLDEEFEDMRMPGELEPAEVASNTYLYGIDTVIGADHPLRGARKSPHKAALTRAHNVADRALKVGKEAKARADQYDPKKHSTIVPVKPTVVKGTVVLGVSTNLTAAQQAAVKKHTNAIARHKDAVDVSKKKAARAISDANKLKKLAQDKTGAVNQLLKPKGMMLAKSILGGSSYWPEIVGIAAPDPLNPGFLTDGTVDPSYTEAGSSEAAVEYVPPVRNQALSRDDALIEWKKLPENGVVYDGRYGIPEGKYHTRAVHDAFGSAGGYYGGEGNPGKHNMYRWSGGPPERWVYYSGGKKGNANDANQKTVAEVQRASMTRGWGPLIGDPNHQYAKGLQYAVDENKWFWQSEVAPSWATVEADRALAELDKKTKEAARSLAEAETARRAQEQAQMDEDKAKQDAANALALSAADTQSQVAMQQQAAQQAQIDQQQQAYEQKTAAQQAQLAMQQEAAQTKVWQQQQALMSRAQQADLEYAIAHPEVAMQQAYDEYPSSDEQGVDWGEGQPAESAFTPEEIQQYEEAGAPASAVDEL